MGEKLTACLAAFLSAALLIAVSVTAARAEHTHLPAGVVLAVPGDAILTAEIIVRTKEKKEIKKRLDKLEEEKDKKKKEKVKEEAGEEKKKAEPEPKKKKTKKQCKNDCIKDYENCVKGKQKTEGTSCLRYRKECLFACKAMRR